MQISTFLRRINKKYKWACTGNHELMQTRIWRSKNFTCSPSSPCVSCIELKGHQKQNELDILLSKQKVHDCHANWDGSSQAMEGYCAFQMLDNIINKYCAYVAIIVKDDNGTITANCTPRKWTKKKSLIILSISKLERKFQ